MRQLFTGVVFFVVVVGLLISSSLFLSAGHYSVTSIGARWIAFVAVMAAECAVVIRFSLYLSQSDPEYRRWFVNGASIAVATMAIILAVLAAENANGALDQTARRITVRVQSQGSVAGFDSLTVDD